MLYGPLKSTDLRRWTTAAGVIVSSIILNLRRGFVPFHRKDLPKGTLLAILKQAGISKDDLWTFNSQDLIMPPLRLFVSASETSGSEHFLFPLIYPVQFRSDNIAYLTGVQFLPCFSFDLPAMPLDGLGKMSSCVGLVTMIIRQSFVVHDIRVSESSLAVHLSSAPSRLCERLIFLLFIRCSMLGVRCSMFIF